MPAIRRPAFLAAAAVVVALLHVEPAVQRDLSAGSGSVRLSVGAIRVPLWSVAFAQGSGSVSLESVSVTFGPSTYSIPRIEFSGLASSEADIRAVFDAASTEPLGTRLARISAKRVAIPEVVLSEEFGEVRQRTVYRNVIAEDVERGRVRLATADNGATETTALSHRGTLVQERLRAEDTDVAGLVRIYAEKAGPEPGPMTRIQGAYSAENVTYAEERAIAVKVARYEVRDLSMRPTPESWTASLITALHHPLKWQPRWLLAAIVETFDAVSVGSTEAIGIEFAGVAKVVERDGGAKDDPFALRIRRLAYRSANADRPADARLEGFEFAMPDGLVKIEAASYTGFSFEPTLRGLRALKAKPLEQFDAADARGLIPTLGTIRYSGLLVEAPAQDNGGDRMRIGLKESEFAAEKPLNGVPTELRAALRNLTFTVPRGSKDETARTIRELGYRELDLSGGLSMGWNEAEREIVVREVALGGARAGRISLSAVLGGATRDLFDPDPAVAARAAVAATAKKIEVTVEDEGLFERYLRLEARKRKTTPEAIRAEYAAAASLMVPVVLGNSKQAQTVGEAVGRFIAKPARLRITARSIEPAGVGLVDLAGTASPAALIDKLDISATAE